MLSSCVRPSVCLSVRPAHARILPKRLNICRSYDQKSSVLLFRYSVYSTCTHNLATLASAVPEIRLRSVEIDKKLRVCRGTARRCILVSSYFVSVWHLEKFQSPKVTFKVIQGHWHLCHSIGHIRFLISLLLQLYLFIAPLTRYCHLFSKIKWLLIQPFRIIYDAFTSTPAHQSPHEIIWSAYRL